jgi:hypothetical protein
MVTSPSIGVDALRAMRNDRRRHRVADMEWFEALYKVYIAAFVGGSAILFLSGLSTDTPLTSQQLANLTAHTPHAVGLVAALVVFIGLRSGANGGPIAVEEPEVRHVLLAPLDHAAVLRHPAIQRLRTFAFAGAIAGGTANQLLGRRVPQAGTSLVLFAMWGALAGALMGTLFITAALIVHGLGMKRWAATALGTVLAGWQIAVTFNDSHISGPFDTIGSLSMWWLRHSYIDIVGVVAILLLAAFAVALAGRLSLEALSRRSSLVSQMKFAVTLQDIRTVVLLRRQLSQEHMRVKPWVKIPRLLRKDVVIGRGFRSMAHFPLRRVIRMQLLTMTGAAALVSAWRGTTPAIVVAGLMFFIVGLDAVEPLSQEVDQPDRTDALPLDRGLLMVKHLFVPALFMLPFFLAGVVVAYVAEPHAQTFIYAFIIGIPALLGGVAGAAINTVNGAPDPAGGATQGLAMPPEVAGMTTMVRAVWPTAISIISCTPVLAMRHGFENGVDMLGNTLRAAGGVVILLILVGGWVRQRDAIHIWFRNIQKAGTTSSTVGGN